MQTRDEVEGLHNCREFSQRLECRLIGKPVFDRGPGVFLRSRSQGPVTSTYNLLNNTVKTYQVQYVVIGILINVQRKMICPRDITRMDAAQQV